ncbi:hypothetical protein C8T65DRAFT_698094 [Cerioporus squamosus]|nr:hypothetical protein C8T65DRAFT_698094 [Cerioporus squamosus]
MPNQAKLDSQRTIVGAPDDPCTPNGARILVRATPENTRAGDELEGDEPLSDVPVASDNDDNGDDDDARTITASGGELDVGSDLDGSYELDDEEDQAAEGEAVYMHDAGPVYLVSPHRPIPGLQAAFAYPALVAPGDIAAVAPSAIGAPVYACHAPAQPVQAGQAPVVAPQVLTNQNPSANASDPDNHAVYMADASRGQLLQSLAEGAGRMSNMRRDIASGAMRGPSFSPLPPSSPIQPSIASSQTAVERPSSSPINVDWSSDANASVTQASDPRDAQCNRMLSEDSDSLYWRHVETPMGFEDARPPPLRSGLSRRHPVRSTVDQAMDVDSTAEDDAHGHERGNPEDQRAKTSKGKGRATRLDSEDEGEDEQPEGKQDDGWNEAEVLEARQRSLRQLLRDRAGAVDHHQEEDVFRDAWGSGVPYDSDVPFSRSRVSGRAGPSGARQGAEEPRVAREFETQEWSASSGLRRGFPAQSGVSRERSFLPLPNTRAEEYVRHRGGRTWADREMEQLPQRSPASQIGGLRRPATMAWQSRSMEAIRTPRPRAPTILEGLADPFRMQEVEHGEWDQQEDGELVPTIMQGGAYGEDRPTETPRGGFPLVHHDDPETRIRGMALDWVREMWGDPPHSVVMLDIFNYRASDDDSLNRRIEEAVRTNVQVTTGEVDFDVVPPEPEQDVSLRTRDRPTRWAIRGLTRRGVECMLERRVWSYRSITFFTSPRATSIPSWICMLDGFLNANVNRIRPAILRVLTERGMRTWIARMVAANPEFRGRETEDVVEQIIGSLRVEALQLGNGNYVVNMYIRSPTRDVREWRRWVAELRARRYPSFANGTGRVRNMVPCSGCRGTNHPTHMCPFPMIRGWNGPRPGEGVFGETRENSEGVRGGQQGRGQWNGDARRGAGRDRGGRGFPWTPRGRGGPPNQKRGGGSSGRR